MSNRILASTLGVFLAATALGQTAERATVILGAGRAGSWDTRIAVTNDDLNPIDVVVTAQPDRVSCGASPCNDLAATTIPGHGTFVLASIPDPAQPGFSNAPQAIYVLSPSDQNAPAVSASAF